MHLNPYLMFNGQCEAAFTFYERCLEGKLEAMMKYAGSPAASHTAPEWGDKILHASLKVGDHVLMGSDAEPERYQAPRGLYITLNLKDTAHAERLFQQLSEGGEVQMPLQQTFWADRYGMLVDRFGIPWMINCGRAA